MCSDAQRIDLHSLETMTGLIGGKISYFITTVPFCSVSEFLPITQEKKNEGAL